MLPPVQPAGVKNHLGGGKNPDGNVLGRLDLPGFSCSETMYKCSHHFQDSLALR